MEDTWNTATCKYNFLSTSTIIHIETQKLLTVLFRKDAPNHSKLFAHPVVSRDQNLIHSLSKSNLEPAR